MRQSPGHLRFWIGGGLVLVSLITALGVVIGDVDRFKHTLEGAASHALGMPVRVDGHLRLDLAPGPQLAADGLRILGDSNQVLLSAKRIRFQLVAGPLLVGRLRLNRLELVAPELAVVRDRQGRFDVEQLVNALPSRDVLDGARVSIADGAVDIRDVATGATSRATGIALDIQGLHVPRGSGSSFWRHLTGRADLRCGELRSSHLTVTDAHLVVTARSGVLDVAPITLAMLGSRLSASLLVDLSGPTPDVHLDCALPRFRVEQFPGPKTGALRLVGTMDFTTHLTTRGTSTNPLLRNLGGTLSLRGRDLVLDGSDLDRTFARYESSQNFSLVDLGAVFLAGPAGLAITRGYGFAGLLEGTGGHSRIGTLVSDWTLDRGSADAKDVAMATTANRFALQGHLDLVDERFEDLSIAVVDAHGCARLRQAIHGSFDHPVVEKPEALGAIAGPMVKLYQRARGLFPSKPCVPFYLGIVPPPR